MIKLLLCVPQTGYFVNEILVKSVSNLYHNVYSQSYQNTIRLTLLLILSRLTLSNLFYKDLTKAKYIIKLKTTGKISSILFLIVKLFSHFEKMELFPSTKLYLIRPIIGLRDGVGA